MNRNQPTPVEQADAQLAAERDARAPDIAARDTKRRAEHWQRDLGEPPQQ